jgi:hypothetical protein
VLPEGKFERIWTQSAAGDAGGTVFATYYFATNAARAVNAMDSMRGSYPRRHTRMTMLRRASRLSAPGSRPWGDASWKVRWQGARL